MSNMESLTTFWALMWLCSYSSLTLPSVACIAHLVGSDQLHPTAATLVSIWPRVLVSQILCSLYYSWSCTFTSTISWLSWYHSSISLHEYFNLEDFHAAQAAPSPAATPSLFHSHPRLFSWTLSCFQNQSHMGDSCTLFVRFHSQLDVYFWTHSTLVHSFCVMAPQKYFQKMPLQWHWPIINHSWIFSPS